MRTQRLRPFFAALLAIGMLSSGVYAQNQPPPAAPDEDPGAVARRCIRLLRAVSEACATHMVQTAREAARRINHLQENDQPRRARQVAHAALGRIREAAMHCQGRIEQITRRCLHRLHELGAPDELLAAVREASQRASEHVRVAAHRAAQIVITALQD